jgi:hypothetical protein
LLQDNSQRGVSTVEIWEEIHRACNGETHIPAWTILKAFLRSRYKEETHLIGYGIKFIKKEDTRR